MYFESSCYLGQDLDVSGDSAVTAIGLVEDLGFAKPGLGFQLIFVEFREISLISEEIS